MLEIFVIIFFCRKMGEILRDKRWKTTVWMQVLVALVWLACEFFGSLAYGIFITLTQGPEAARTIGFAAYLVALPCGLAGVGILFFIAKHLPCLPPDLPAQPREPGSNSIP